MGLQFFFHSLFVTLERKEHLIDFHETLQNLENRTNYFRFFEELMKSDEIISDYYLTGLELFTLVVDWKYFFDSSNEVVIETYRPFSNYANLIEDFNGILSCSVFSSQLQTFNRSSRSVQYIFNDLIVNRIFFVKWQPSLCGLTTYSLRIFIND